VNELVVSWVVIWVSGIMCGWGLFRKPKMVVYILEEKKETAKRFLNPRDYPFGKASNFEEVEGDKEDEPRLPGAQA